MWTTLEHEYGGDYLCAEMNLHDSTLVEATRFPDGAVWLLFKTIEGATAIRFRSECQAILWSSGMWAPSMIHGAVIDTYQGWQAKGMPTLLDKQQEAKLLGDVKSFLGEDSWIVIFYPIYGDGFAVAGQQSKESFITYSLFDDFYEAYSTSAY